MSLHIPPAPAAAERSVLAALHPATPHLPHPLHVDRGALTPALPLPLHRLLPAPSSGALPDARLTGWRFLLERGGRAVGAAETMLTADGWAFSHFCEGPYIASTERVVRLAESLPDAYQPRLLSVPELYMLTLWLHADVSADPATGGPGPQDLLVPLAPAPPGIAADQPMRVEALVPLMSTRLAPAGPAAPVA
ncbi:hypothetical protein [Streptomyces sp. 7-21]|jgi:hypothetical protein|uniref:hypothetical protein n=1 Tax=Streptomyces sp. 7-21 TaxID=2802283 RepID=UPI00191D2238|nr:hypothetical protein [Streptomyces sp. 7-21]MBL1067196.1 hypothetical protein [Streptomyces sp. 7-21]